MLLARVGLHRPELRAWALYDWANSAFVLGIQTAIFPVYFLVAAGADLGATEATARLAWTNSLALAITALLAPVLGALADYRAIRKRLLATFLGLGVSATAAMVLVEHGEWLLGLVLFGLGNVGAQGSFVFYDSLLVHVARDDREMDRASAAGYALGYLGSSILFVVQIALIQRPAWFGLPTEGTLPTRLAFLSIAVWWLVFALPLLRRVPEPPRRIEPDESVRGNALRVAVGRLRETFHELRTYREALLMLVAFLIYNDGIGTIIRMASIYGAGIGIERGDLLLAILIAQLVGIPFAILFGGLAGAIGVKRAILAGLAVYIGVTIYAYFMRTAVQFYVLAVIVGMVQGGTQALSRSLFASLIPRHKSSEFFGFYGVLDKFAGIVGPAVFGLTITLTDSSRAAILSVILFFVVGALLLTGVRVDEGRSRARAAEAGVREAG